jgi:hypothetical protein
MNLKYLFIVTFCLISANFLLAQYNAGARQISLANSDVALSDDVFALFNNPAGLSQLKWREIGLYYSPAPFGLSELANGYIAYNEPFGFGSLAIGGMSYGFELYRESKILLGYSYNYNNKFFAGASINYHTFSIQNYGNTGVLYFNVGGLAFITNEFSWGFSVSNVNRASVGNEDDQIPTIISTGLSYRLLEQVKINLALEKDISFSPSFRFGIDYSIIKYLSLRIGASNSPSRFTGGIGINYSLFKLDYAVFTHPDLGLTHQAGLIIQFNAD